MIPKKYRIEILLYVSLLVVITLGLAEIEAFELLYDYSRLYEEWELDEIVLVIPAATVCMFLFAYKRMREVREKARHLEQSREEVMLAQEKLIEMDRSREEFLAVACHELRSPLSGIVNSLTLMDLAESEDERKESQEYAKSTALAMAVLIEDVLTFARISHGGVEERNVFAPADLLASAQGLLQLKADAKGLELTVAIDEKVPPEVSGSEAGLRLAVLNLVGNGIKYTESGGVSVRCGCNEEGFCSELVFKVIDTGVGISEDEQKTIFDPYRKVGNNGAHSRGGIGLGLSLVKRLVESLGGTITVSSTPGAGSEFVIRVPVDPV